MLTALTFFLVLSLLVFIHELGHYLVARIIGVHVEEFGFGLPPRIAGIKWGKTLYSINWLPIGGFVKLAGEDEEDRAHTHVNQHNRKTFFWARSKRERAAILLAGVTMNFLLAVGITGVLLVRGVPEPTETVRVEKVLPGSPAEKAGLEEGDTIRTIATVNQEAMSVPGYDETVLVSNVEVKTPKDLIDTVKSHLGSTLLLTFVRNGETKTVSIIPRSEYPKGEGPMGVGITNLETRSYSLAEAPVKALSITIERGYLMITSVAQPLLKLLTFQNVCGEVAGPIGIARATGQAVQYGFWAVLEFMAILSLNLAVLNVLPIPALDGGRLAFVVLEKFIGKKVRPQWERAIHQVGMMLLLSIIVLISINDIFCPAFG